MTLTCTHTLLDSVSPGPKAGSNATPRRLPLPREPPRLREFVIDRSSESVSLPSRKFSGKREERRREEGEEEEEEEKKEEKEEGKEGEGEVEEDEGEKDSNCMHSTCTRTSSSDVCT